MGEITGHRGRGGIPLTRSEEQVEELLDKLDNLTASKPALSIDPEK